MARLKTMGTVRRQLFRVRTSGDMPVLPAPLFQNGKRIGELRTAIALRDGLVGLALLSTLSLNVELPVHFSEAGTSPAVVVDLS